MWYQQNGSPLDCAKSDEESEAIIEQLVADSRQTDLDLLAWWMIQILR